MASSFRTTMLLCAVASAASVVSAERLPGLLENAPLRPISARFNMPDWVSYAGRCFDAAEDELITRHPRVDVSASNIREGHLFEGRALVRPFGALDLDMYQTCVTHIVNAAIAPSPVSEALRAAAGRDSGDAPIMPDSVSRFGAGDMVDLPSTGVVSSR